MDAFVGKPEDVPRISAGFIPAGSQLSSYQTQCHEKGISFGLVPMGSQLGSYQTRRHADAISFWLAPMGSQLAG
ncbi:MAG TPA: hypothetical protein PLY87_25260 [Planctomycetaceae bacterium]|nr:hypothetical protein [Planctomycetaceae bacterium]HQZ68432.1 hypothetical protein [Planctomycetaceae bacterium]